ncbi:MAG: JAB domain-containing protein [Lachnospiraceae bacterium]|nr:JAB domain-containing protein [Lachnospiraceae bacterium]
MRITTYTTRIKDNLNVLVKERAYNYKTENSHLESADKVVKMMCDVFQIHLRAEEYVYLLSLDTKCKVLGIFEVGHGTVNACLLHTREIMIRNVLCGASAFIVAHNHPSGELSASSDDVSTTKKLYEAGELMGIHLLDHIIIGREDEKEAYYSMAEHGLLKE